MNPTYAFVQHSHGEFEGTVYDKVVLSDGLMAFACKNKTGETSFPFKEGDVVKPVFKVRGTKNATPAVDLVKLEK